MSLACDTSLDMQEYDFRETEDCFDHSLLMLDVL